MPQKGNLRPQQVAALCDRDYPYTSTATLVYTLAGSEGLGDNSLEGQLLLLQVISRGILNLKLGHGVAESGLDLLLLATLQADGRSGIRDHLLNAGNV
jgi:hypothetical protein